MGDSDGTVDRLLVEGQSYPVWSPDRASAAAEALLDALREDRGAT